MIKDTRPKTATKMTTTATTATADVAATRSKFSDSVDVTNYNVDEKNDITFYFIFNVYVTYFMIL